MIRTIADFESSWKFENEMTVTVLKALTDASLSQAVGPGGRTLGFIAWHLAVSIPEMLGQAKIAIEGPDREAPVPASVAEIVAAYEKAAAAAVPAVRAAWTDEQLTEMIPMYGETWPKGVVLSALMAHQGHHRGQMTVLMRQAGLRVPGVYGPSAEEWAQYGMPVMP